MRAAVHQPQYFPYPGFFHKLKMADVFVVMDDVQYERGFINRNRILDSHGPLWLTVPIRREDKFRPIAEVAINDEIPWAAEHWKKILVSYSNARFFDLYRARLESIFSARWGSLCELNMESLKMTMDWLGIRIPIIRESELGVRTTGSQRLVDVCKSIGADVYVSGRGGRDYINEADFKKANVKLEYQSYVPVPYLHRLAGSFVPDLSILDALANVGPDTKTLIDPQRPLVQATG